MIYIRILVVTLLCFAPPATALEKVTLQLKWKHQFQFAGYYVAQQLGYYREVGLEVELLEAAPETDVVQKVIAGAADYGVGSNNLVLAREGGHDVVVLAVILQHSPYLIIAAAGPEMGVVQDLVGRSLMLEPMADELVAYLQAEGISLDQVELEQHSYDAQTLISGEVAAMSAYSSDEPYFLDKQQFPYLIFSPLAAGIDFYGDNLFTTGDTLRRQPQRSARLREASLRGWRYAMDHPQQVVDLILEHYPTLKSRDQLLYEAEKMRKLMRPELIEVGYMLRGRWQHIANTYIELGMLPRDYRFDDGLLYDPQPDYRRYLYWGGGAALLLTLLTLSLFYVIRMNRQLDHMVHLKSYQANIGESVNYISHQWKQPLHELGIQLMLLETEAAKLPGEKQALQEATAESHRLLGFMEKTVETYRFFLDTRSQQEVFDPAAVIDEVLQLFGVSLRRQGIELEVVLEKGLRVEGSVVELSHLLLTLILNGRDLLLEREIAAPLLVISLQRSGSCVVITVTDNGGGIELQPVSAVFRRGVRAKSSPGAGLGLYVAKQLAERLQGTIRAENRGEGACFTLTLPLFSGVVPEARGGGWDLYGTSP
ncbi:MAG: ABC transporter substrate-binding protein [Gammaproteobacteria bacterium]|nr:ABC transporter substrate-binding protein [Gammaproteobacteria bacterium]